MVEKRRRDRINLVLNEIRDLLPQARGNAANNKVLVLEEAVQHVNHLNARFNTLRSTLSSLQQANARWVDDLSEAQATLARLSPNAPAPRPPETHSSARIIGPDPTCMMYGT